MDKFSTYAVVSKIVKMMLYRTIYYYLKNLYIYIYNKRRATIFYVHTFQKIR